MKKYLFKQVKKSFSLLMAVIMLMSCWVWLAPEEAKKAEAISNFNEKYRVTFSYSVSGQALNSAGITYKYLTDEGWGGEGNNGNHVTPTLDSSASTNGTAMGGHQLIFDSDNFPSVIKFSCKGPNETSCNAGDAAVVAGFEVKINGVTVFKGGSDVKWTQDAKDHSYEFYPNLDGSGKGRTGNYEQGSTWLWDRPYIAGFDNGTATSSANTDLNITLGKVGTSAVSATATSFDYSKYTCVNQYGVKISDSRRNTLKANGYVYTVTEKTHIAGNDNSGTAISDDAASYITASGNAVTVNPALQTVKKPDDNGYITYYLVKVYTFTDGTNSWASNASVKVNVKCPKYDIVYNAKGTVDDAAFAPTVKVGDTTYTNTYKVTDYYDRSFTLPSDKDVNAEGYTFYGFWSDPQPTSGAAWFYSKKADFAQPISTEEFNDYAGKGGTVSDTDAKLMTYDADGDGTAEKYYNAGTQITEKLIKGDKEVYGWWCSNDYTVKFYDVDGKFINEFAVKYGQTADAIKAQNNNKLPASAYDTYTSGAFTYNVVPDTWVTGDGSEITLSSHRFTDSLILTPKIERKSFDNDYTVKFTDLNGNAISVGSQGGVYNYRQNITDEANSASAQIPATLTVDNVLDETDLHYSYAFVGWTNVSPTGKNYHILLEDANFDLDGKAISLNEDWIVRGDTAYYAVYRRQTKSYNVKFVYNDTTGTSTSKTLVVKYGDKLTPPADVPVEYNTRGNKYTFAKWEYVKDQGGNTATFDKNATLDFISENILIYSGALSSGTGAITINATYGDPVATPFNVSFTYPDAEGEDITKSANVIVDTDISEAFTGVKGSDTETPFDIATALAPAAEFDDGAAVYTYANSWKLLSGAGTMGLGGAAVAVGTEITTANLKSFVPTSDVEFEAVYANPVYYRNVTYIDGNNTFTDKALAGSTAFPVWTNKVTNDAGEVEDKEYTPEDYKKDGGTYVFQGWFDAEQTDKEYKKTNGTPITDYTAVPDHDITFYSQFVFVPDTFSVEFKNYDGSENIAWGEFQYGWSLEMLTAQAGKAAQNSREDDPVYDYIFIGWDKTVPTFCEGKDLVFIAQYKAVYKYYDAKWYNSTAVKNADGEIIGWAADKSTEEDENGNNVEVNLLATTKHTYDSKLYTPSVEAFTCPEAAPEGQNFVFAGWCYDVKDEDGNVVETKKYERGMKITSGMEFYATYALTDKTYTVTAVVNGATTTYTVASGETVNLVEPQDGYVDETYHNEFIGWTTDAEGNTAFDEDAAITADITVYAQFDVNEHDFSKKQLKTAPTYYAKGVNEVWCECDSTKTYEEDIPMLTDNVEPTGTIYLGSLGAWSSTDAQGAAATDGDEVTLYANADTDIIITANDTGDYDALYNPSATGIGVKTIKAFVYPGDTALTAQNYGAALQAAITVYENNTTDLTNNANFAVKLGEGVVVDLDDAGNAQYDDGVLRTKALESGKVYIVYYSVTDKAGKMLNTKVRTAKFIYDNTAPVFTVEGFNNGLVIPTYCGTATVTGLEEGAVLTVNGTEVEVAADGTYKISYAEGVDNVIITATDKAGNTYSKKIKVSDHNYYVREVLSDCYNPGYKEAECLICHDKKDRVEYPATGHVMGMPVITPADCFNNGYVTVKCENCDYEVKTKFEEDGVTPLFPKLDHKYELDAENNIVYTTVTASTCSTKGMAEAYCTACGEGIIDKNLALDPENHEKVTVTEVKADCEYDGYYTETCICGKVIKDEKYPATGHGTVEDGTAEWYVKKENSCCENGEEALKCLNSGCGEDIDTKVIPADKALHEFYIKNEETDVQRPGVGVEGKITWTCKVCGETKEEKRGEALEGFDVKFVTDDGETAFTDLISGTVIGKTQVAEPTKAATEKYTYKFAGWVEVITNEDDTTSDGATYKLPLTVTKDITLKATFRATPILYTHTFYVPNTWVSPLEGMTGYDEYAVLIGTYGDTLEPASEPVFKLADEEADAELKKLYTFEFKGWKDVLGNVVTDFTVSTDTTFYAYFDAIPVAYTVTYLNGTDFVWSTIVDGGEAVVYENKDAEGNIIYPEKAFDDTYHYTFAKWYSDASLKTEYKGEAITSKTQLYAGFTPVEHSGYVVDTTAGANKDGIVQKATCALPELTQYICTCGHTKLVETKAALNHKDADGNSTIKTETVEKEDGIYNVTKCTVCGVVISETKTSYTVVFKNWNGITLQTSILNAGADIKYEKDEPVKADDAEYTYKFKGWCVYGDTTETIVTLGTATEDTVYTAVFTKTAKTFRVTFVDKDNKVITTKDGLAYGYKLTAADFPADQADYYTDIAHYTFAGWSADVDYEVKADLLVSPEFKVEAHKWYNTGETVGATCEEAGGIIWKCESCDATSIRDGANATGHKWEEIERVEPDLANEKDGYYIEKCSVCGKVSDKIVIPVAKKVNIVITVKDQYGKPIQSALVELYKDGSRVAGADTNADGQVTFKDYAGKYTVLVSKVEDAENVSFEIKVGENGYSGDAIMEIAEEGCTCSCHRNGFWGIVFRFFHKIISFFTGRIGCCADPDSRY